LTARVFLAVQGVIHAAVPQHPSESTRFMDHSANLLDRLRHPCKAKALLNSESWSTSELVERVPGARRHVPQPSQRRVMLVSLLLTNRSSGSGFGDASCSGRGTTSEAGAEAVAGRLHPPVRYAPTGFSRMRCGAHLASRAVCAPSGPVSILRAPALLLCTALFGLRTALGTMRVPTGRAGTRVGETNSADCRKITPLHNKISVVFGSSTAVCAVKTMAFFRDCVVSCGGQPA
jgi:hypothetical protein